MAITIIKGPDIITPVYNTNYIKLIDSNCIQADYKYIVKIYLDGITDPIGTFKYSPLQDGSFEFNANEIICNYMTNNNYTYEVLPYEFRTSIFKYSIVIDRTYSGAAQATIYSYTNLYAFDGALKNTDFDYLDYVINDIIPTTITTYNYGPSFTASTQSEINDFIALTVSMPSNPIQASDTIAITTVPDGTLYETVASDVNLIAGDVYEITTTLDNSGDVFPPDFFTGSTIKKYWLTYSSETEALSNVADTICLSRFDYYSVDFFRKLPTSSTQAKWLNILFTVGNNTYPLKTNIIDATDDVSKNIISIGIGAPNHIDTIWTDGFGGVYSDIFNTYNFDSYQIWLSDVDNKPVTKTITINLSSLRYEYNTKNYDRTWLIYKSRLGGWSWLLFNMKGSKKQDVEQTTYTRRLKYNERSQYRGNTVISSNVLETFILNTDWVKDSEKTFYEDLYSSPQVFMYRSKIDGVEPRYNMIPVVVKTNSAPIYQKNNDKLFYYQIEVQAALQNKRQRT